MTTPVRRIGRVVDAGGRPVPGALLVLVDGPPPLPEIALVADARGRFVVALPPGRWTVQAHGPSAVGEATWTLDGPSDDAELVVALAG